MRLFDRYTSLWLVVCCLPLLFLPKINLVSLGGKETAGLRIDDLVLLMLAVTVFWAHFALNKKTCPIERLVSILVAFSLFSFVMNRIFVTLGYLNVNASLFYCLRMAEYFVFFYIGSMSIQFFRTSTIIKAFLFWNMILMLLQKVGVVGEFTSAGYIPPSDYDRVTGIASFPSEMGLLINLAFCYLIYSEDKSSFTRLIPAHLRPLFEKNYIYWMFLICMSFVIITGARIAIVAMIVIFFFRVKDDLKQGSIRSWVIGFGFVALGAWMTFVLIQKTESVFERSAGLLSWRNLDLIAMVWEQIDLNYVPIGNEAVSFDGYDMSWWMRIHKWIYAFKIFFINPECYLQGIGPGFAMAALDGGFLRILVEYGLVGCYLFWQLFSSIARQSAQLKWMIVAILINMIFFDVYLAYKPMSILFFISGCTYAYHLAKIKTPAQVPAS